MRVRLRALGLVAALCAAAPAVAAAAEAGGALTVQIRAGGTADGPVVAEQVLYGASYALVIGIDDYANGWPRLKTAVKDAQLVASALEERGFQVTLKKNLAANELREALREFFIIQGEDPDARLFLWYAGHGHTSNGEGFLVPADAPPPTAGGKFRLKALHMRDFSGLVRLAESKHVMSIFDSCFAGTVFDTRAGMPTAAISRATALPVRQFITSGDTDQEVSDDGTFRALFMRAIEGDENADANGDGYLTGGELGFFLNERVTNLTEAAQTPRFGKLRDRNYDQGDFVFAIPAALARAAAARAWQAVKYSTDTTALEGFLTTHPDSDFAQVVRVRLTELAALATGDEETATRRWSEQQALVMEGSRRQAEIAFWDSVKDSSSPEDFGEYLEQFPEGTFAGLAKRRLKALDAERTAALTPAPAESTPEIEVSPLDELMVAVKTANVRSAPTTGSRRVGRIMTGTAVAVTGRMAANGADWYRVVLDDGEDGFIFGTLLQEEAAWADAERLRAAERAAEEQRRAAEKQARSAAEQAAAQQQRLQAQAVTEEQVELAHWRAIENSTDKFVFESYLAKYPNGRFADAARAKLATQVAIVVPPAEADPRKAVKSYLATRRGEFRQQLAAYVEANTSSTRMHELYTAKFVDSDGGVHKLRVVAKLIWNNNVRWPLQRKLDVYLRQEGDAFVIARVEFQ